MGRFKAFLKQQWHLGGQPIKLISLIVVIYVLKTLISWIFTPLNYGENLNYLFKLIFVAESSFFGTITKPWTLITSIFMHGDFSHLILNVLVIYFTAKMFVPIFGEKRFMSVFFTGAIFGILLDMAISELLNHYANQPFHGIIGSSGGAMSVLTTMIVYDPKQKIRFFGIIPMPLYVLGIILVASDVISILTPGSNIAYLVHIGGAFIGFLAGYNAASSSNVFNKLSSFFYKSDQRVHKPKRKKKVNTEFTPPPKNDYDYVSQKRAEEDKINKILEKIKLKGYDSLTKKEKETLFTASKKK